MRTSTVLAALAFLGLLLQAPAGAQQAPPAPKPPEIPQEKLEKMGPLETVIYKKEMEEEYRKTLERQRRWREMEAWDNQRRLVKRKMLDVQCTWSRPGGKKITKVFKQRVAETCEAALADLSRDLGRPLSADCSCSGSSPPGTGP